MSYWVATHVSTFLAYLQTFFHKCTKDQASPQNDAIQLCTSWLFDLLLGMVKNSLFSAKQITRINFWIMESQVLNCDHRGKLVTTLAELL